MKAMRSSASTWQRGESGGRVGGELERVVTPALGASPKRSWAYHSVMGSEAKSPREQVSPTWLTGPSRSGGVAWIRVEAR